MSLLLVTLLAVAVLPGRLPSQEHPSPLYGVFVRSSRVAVLPFVNYTDSVDISDSVFARVRAALARQAVEMADSEAQSELLRQRRIRNTSELTSQQLQLLADNLQVSYILVGTVDRYTGAETGAEVALSARLIYAPTREIVWASSAIANGTDSWWPLRLGRRNDVSRLLNHAVHRLFRSFDYRLPPRVRRVAGIRPAGGGISALNHLALVTPANETSTSFAGQVFSSLLLSELLKAGFKVSDPGLVREAMLHESELAQGSSSADVLTRFREQLGVDAILTGTVSEFYTPGREASGNPVRVSVEARLVSTQTGELWWARTFTATSRRGAIGFGWGDTHSPAVLVRSISRELVHAIPAVRTIVNTPSPEETGTK